MILMSIVLSIILEEAPICFNQYLYNIFGKLEPIHSILWNMRLDLIRTTLSADDKVRAFQLASFSLILHLTPSKSS